MNPRNSHQEPPDTPPVELSATDLGVVEVCLDKVALCLGPVYSDLGKSQFRSMNGSFILSCDEIEAITDEYRKSCSARFQEAHASLTRRWRGILEFFPLRDSDVQPAYPCVDFAVSKSGELIDGWCGQQLQIRIHFAWLSEAGH